MQSAVSVCGTGAVGSYLAITAGKALGARVNLHSLRIGGRSRRLIVENACGERTTEAVEIKKLQNLSDVILLVCDSGRIDQYLSEISKDRSGLPTFIYLMQNGLLGAGCDDQAGNFKFRRISFGGVSLQVEGNILRYRGRRRPLLEISREARLEMSIHGDIAFKTLEAVGNLKVRDKEAVVVWNKLVRSGPHFLDSLLRFQLGWKIGIEERLHIARILFQEYWDVAELACGETLPEKSQALDLVETLVSKNIINSGSRRYMLEESCEEYEAVVGRVRKYAIERGLNVATISMLDYVIRKR